MTTKWQRVTIKIPKTLKPIDREAVGFGIIERIIERTQNAIGFKNNRKTKFPEYTKEYKKKKGSSRVDLTLSEDMLNALQVLSHKNGEIRVGFIKGSKENAKADGNIRGTYGQKRPIAGKARPFLGVNKVDLKRIIKRFT